MTSLPLPKRRKHVNQTRSHAHAPEQEQKIAKRLGGRVTKASGALDEKGDVRLRGVVRVEAKCTHHRSFSIDEDMLSKIEQAAHGDGEMPVIAVDFLNERGGVKRTVCVVPDYVLDFLRDAKD